MHILSMLQTDQKYQNLLKAGCWKQDITIETFLQGKNTKQTPVWKELCPLSWPEVEKVLT